MSVPTSPSPKPEPLWRSCMLRYFYNPLWGPAGSRGERFVCIAVKAVAGALHVGFSLKSDHDAPDKVKARHIAAARATYAAQRPDVYHDGHAMVINTTGLGVTLDGIVEAIRKALARQEVGLLERGGSRMLSRGLAALVAESEPWADLRRDLLFFCRRNAELLGDWAKALPKPEPRKVPTT